MSCDVLVIGDGVAGLQAASRAAGSRIVLVDQAAQLGGRCLWDGSTIDGMTGGAWVRATAERLEQFPETKILPVDICDRLLRARHCHATGDSSSS